MAPFWKRVTQPIPDPADKEVIWIHGVSVGEIKSAQTLYKKLRETDRETFFLITTTTTTGQAEARRSIPDADAICYLPIDFPWLVSKWVRALKPKCFILIESDFWPFLLRAVCRNGGKNILVSGRLSEKSTKRFALLSPLSKRLFRLFDLICVQNEENYARFLPLVDNTSHLHIGGNLKLDIKPEPVDSETWRAKIAPGSNAIAITCTHSPEETQILDALGQDPELFLFLAPRHPERFEEVAALLQQRNIPFCRFSQLEQKRGGERVLLVDAMGNLAICYALSRLAVVCGSFAPIGGHNIMEPCLYGIPVLFGPHMHTQTEFVSRVLSSGAGLQIGLPSLSTTIQSILKNSYTESQMRKGVTQLIESSGGAVDKTFNYIYQVFI